MLKTNVRELIPGNYLDLAACFPNRGFGYGLKNHRHGM